MADENNDETPGQGDDRNAGDGKTKEPMIPKSRFDEVNNRYKAAQAELDKIADERKRHEEDLAKRRGDFDTLEKSWQQEREGYKKEIRRMKEDFVLSEAMRQAHLRAKPSWIREHASEMGVEALDSLEAIQKVVGSFSAQHPELVTKDDRSRDSTPGSGDRAREETAKTSDDFVDEVYANLFVSPMSGFGMSKKG